MLLCTLEETGFFNASLYTPFGIRGVETLGVEIGEQVRARYGRDPDAVVITHAGGGNLTGTARGLLAAGCDGTRIVACSVDLGGLHMASDHDFNRKSFTTGHTGFGVPFATWPDRVDVPRNAARSLRYMDEIPAGHPGRGLLRDRAADQAGRPRARPGRAIPASPRPSPWPARWTGTRSSWSRRPNTPAPASTTTASSPSPGRTGSRCAWGSAGERPGRAIVIPERLEQVRTTAQDMDRLRRSYLSNAAERLPVPQWSRRLTSPSSPPTSRHPGLGAVPRCPDSRSPPSQAGPGAGRRCPGDSTTSVEERLDLRTRALDELDEELKARFWSLCDQVVDPSWTWPGPIPHRPSSAPCCCGWASTACQPGCGHDRPQAGLLGKGAGHVVLHLRNAGHRRSRRGRSDAGRPDVLQGLFDRAPGAPGQTPHGQERGHA